MKVAEQTEALSSDRKTLSIKGFVILAVVGILPVALSMLLPYGAFADIDSLPAHPLIVHGVIVLVPIAALWSLIAMWKPKIFQKTYIPLFALSIVGTLGVIAAKSSGDSLTAAVGLPNSHADIGNRMIPVMIGMSATILLAVFFLILRPMKQFGKVTRVLSSLFALAVLPLTYLAGHTGAESVWEEEYAEAQLPISREDLVFSLTEVQQRDSKDACWTVVEGVVYDMTTFIQRHPAGSGDIEDMCGEDATEDFLGEHSGQGEPEKWLDTLRIGTIGR